MVEIIDMTNIIVGQNMAARFFCQGLLRKKYCRTKYDTTSFGIEAGFQ